MFLLDFGRLKVLHYLLTDVTAQGSRYLRVSWAITIKKELSLNIINFLGEGEHTSDILDVYPAKINNGGKKRN